MPMEIIADSDMSAITSGRVDNDIAGQNGPVLRCVKGTRYPAIRHERTDDKALALLSSYLSAHPSASPESSNKTNTGSLCRKTLNISGTAYSLQLRLWIDHFPGFGRLPVRVRAENHSTEGTKRDPSVASRQSSATADTNRTPSSSTSKTDLSHTYGDGSYVTFKVPRGIVASDLNWTLVVSGIAELLKAQGVSGCAKSSS
ncbi:hypothetical protein BDV30DRAFT_229887 [Aspergillus minisclerotigenes]|uniref:Uncharacterized protein n=1 Tax=Aspergillus minisclerotigenes TaxID=656917 RepID=A0A5N6IVU5_9EURO|nr:hypothetical protein BDV30DRAFT_229887 [Aspergillus minisclerotigenes]